MLDAASGGAIISKTPREIRELISVMATNLQQFSSKTESSTRRVNEVSLKTPTSDSRFDDMSAMLQKTIAVVNQLAIGQEKLVQKAKVQVCEICGEREHSTDACPSLQEDNFAEVNALGGYA